MKMYCRGALISALLFITGCVNPNIDFEMPDLSLIQPTSSERARLFLGRAVVEGPDGFCVDRTTSRLVAGFAILAPCALFADEVDFPKHPAVMTIQMDRANSALVAGAEEDVRLALTSDDGLLVRDGIEILETDSQDGLVMIHYRVPTDDALDGLSSELWRGLADVDGRLVTVALYSYKDAPLTVDDGRTLLAETVDILRNANK